MKKRHGLILPPNFNTCQPTFSYNTSPKFVILDISTIDFHFDKNNSFYRFFPARDIIEIVASIPVYSDYDPAIVNEIEHRFPPDEIDKMDISMTDFLVSIVVTWFYEYMNLYLPDNIDSYVFEKWLDKHRNEIVMRRHDIY